MAVPGKKSRESSQLPTLCYDIKLTVPTSVDSQPQEISFLDLITNDSKFKNDKESLEYVLSSYVKACGKQSVKEILAERDTTTDENATLAGIIRTLMDYNDQQNADLGVGYTDPEDDDSFIDDSTAAQDILPKNMTNERDGFYVNEKHQPIQARYLSEPSESDNDLDDDDSDDDDSSVDNDKDEEPNAKRPVPEGESKATLQDAPKKRKPDEDMAAKLPQTKRKRSASEVGTPVSIDDRTKLTKPHDETVKKVKKLSDTTSEPCQQNVIPLALPNEIEQEIKSALEKLVKLILADSTSSMQKKIERLYDPMTARELLDLVKKLHRHTNAHRQVVFEILTAKTGISTPLLITRARLLLLNDYDSAAGSHSLNELRDKLKNEINRSLNVHIQAHNQAVKEWQQKIVDNPTKEKNRGPRKNFRLYKTINELIIRCIDRKLETMTMLDSDLLELFLHEQIVPLWEQSGWMTAKKIISEVIRIEYRPLRDMNTPGLISPVSSTPPSTLQPMQAARITPTAERAHKQSPPLSASSPKVSTSHLSPTTGTATKVHSQSNPSRHVDGKTSEIKSSTQPSASSSQTKIPEMATRVATNPIKQQSTPRPMSTESRHNQTSGSPSSKTLQPDIARPMSKPPITSPSDLSIKRSSTSNSATVIDLTTDVYSHHKKQTNDLPASAPRIHSHSSSTKDPSSVQRTAPSTHSSKQQQQQQQQSFATKLPSEKSPAGSFLKEALLTGSSVTSTPKTSSPKISASPLTVDNMLSKSIQSPKSNSSASTNKPSAIPSSPTTPHQGGSSSSANHQRSSGSSSHRPSTDVNHHRADNQMQQPKTSASSSRPPSSTPSAVSNPSSSSRRSTPSGIPSNFSSSLDHQSNHGLGSQLSMSSSLAQSMQWDPAALQLAAALANNPQLLNSSVFDPHLFNSVFGAASNMVSSNPSSSTSSSRQPHSQNTSSSRRT